MSKLNSVSLLVSPQDLWTISAATASGVPNYNGIDLGAAAGTGDGRIFRFVKAGASTLAVGKMQQGPAQTTGWQNLTAVAAAVGDFTIASTSTITAAANELAFGYAVITVTPGVGYTYQISGNAAYTAAAPTLALTDPIQVALTTTSRIDLVANQYSGTILYANGSGTWTGIPTGVAVTPVTAAAFGWIQVSGVANVLVDGTGVVGNQVVTSNAVDGAVEPLTGTTLGNQPIVGTCVTAISNTEYGAVRLSLF